MLKSQLYNIRSQLYINSTTTEQQTRLTSHSSIVLGTKDA